MFDGVSILKEKTFEFQLASFYTLSLTAFFFIGCSLISMIEKMLRTHFIQMQIIQIKNRDKVFCAMSLAFLAGAVVAFLVAVIIMFGGAFFLLRTGLSFEQIMKILGIIIYQTTCFLRIILLCMAFLVVVRSSILALLFTALVLFVEGVIGLVLMAVLSCFDCVASVGNSLILGISGGVMMYGTEMICRIHPIGLAIVSAVGGAAFYTMGNRLFKKATFR